MGREELIVQLPRAVTSPAEASCHAAQDTARYTGGGVSSARGTRERRGEEMVGDTSGQLGFQRD